MRTKISGNTRKLGGHCAPHQSADLTPSGCYDPAIHAIKPGVHRTRRRSCPVALEHVCVVGHDSDGHNWSRAKKGALGMRCISVPPVPCLPASTVLVLVVGIYSGEAVSRN